MAGVSTVPDVLDALVALARAALPDMQVLDGGTVRDIEREAVSIGYTEDDDEPAVEDVRDRAQLTSSPEDERYEIKCASWSWLGSETDMSAVRRRAYEFVDAINDALMADQTLGGLVMEARIPTTSLVQNQVNRGATARVDFVIAIYAETT